MHHMYHSGKGDPICPLGFHPQVRWPTRCKRCFRDYKEHGGRKRDDDIALRKDDTTSSTPSLSTWSSLRKDDKDIHRRSWTSSSNLSKDDKDDKSENTSTTNFLVSRPASWTSTPDLGNLKDDTHANIPTFSITLPKRKQLPTDTGQDQSDVVTVTKPSPKSSTVSKNDTPRTRKPAKPAKETSEEDKPVRRIQVKEVKAKVDEPTNHDVQFLIQLKSKSLKDTNSVKDEKHIDDDVSSIAATETTDTTLVDRNENEYQEQIESLKQELEAMKARCEKAEREKSDILLRRLAAMETTTSKTTASEVLKLQQRCNEVQAQLEDLQDDKKSLSLRVKELESDLDARPTAQAVQKQIEELRSKLMAAETLCEELMDENEDMKKEMREMVEEMEEMQDNFREDQADEYSSLKKELEQTTKNCRILSFKLRKTERKVEQLETEKQEAEKKFKEVSDGKTVLENLERIKHLEQELKVSNEVSVRLQKELDEAKSKISKVEETNKTTVTKTKAPMLSAIGKLPSAEGKVSRESLTRGGSQDDPVQLLRDLQDSLEREADLREQLKFAEEEAQNLRKKASRVEDDNESLVLQLKKMATKARSRRLSPTSNRLVPEPSLEKDEGISDDEDPAELRLLLELSEQEASVLRRKVEEMEIEADTMKRKMKDLQDKLSTKTVTKRTVTGSVTKASSIQEQKMKVLEDETCDLRKKLIEKERDCERLHAELSVTQKRSKGMQKSKSLDGDQQTLDLRRQLQVIEQEAAVLRTKLQTLESENEKLTAENKRLSLLKGTKKTLTDKSSTDAKSTEKISQLETDLTNANKQITELEEQRKNEIKELSSIKTKLTTLETENSSLSDELKMLKDDAFKTLKPRTPKKPTELTTKAQLKTMVNDLEKEIGDYAVLLKNMETSKKKLEEELKSASTTKSGLFDKKSVEVTELKKQVTSLEKELNDYKQNISKEKSKCDELNNNLTKSKEQLKKLEDEKALLKADHDKVLKEKKKLEIHSESLNMKLESALKKQDEASKALQKTEKLQAELTEKQKELAMLKKDLDNLKKTESEKTKLDKQLSEKTNKVSDLEARVKELEEKVKKNDRLLKGKKEKLAELEKELEAEKSKSKEKESQWEQQKHSLEATISAKNVTIDELNRRESSSPDELINLKEELGKTKAELLETKCNIENITKSKKDLEEKLTKLESTTKSELDIWERKASDFESDLQIERKKIERLKAKHEKEQKNRELELSTLKAKIQALEQKSGGSNEKVKQEYEERISKLQNDLAKGKQEYDDLTAKYEILEEEHVVTKAQLVMEKETIISQLKASKEELKSAESELSTLRDTYNKKNDTWIKEKLALEEQLREQKMKSRLSTGNDSHLLEKTRLKSALEEKSGEVEKLRRQSEMTQDQLKNLRKENDDLKQKLDDFDKVSKIQRNISADSSVLEREIQQLKNKLNHAEKTRKTDLAECKMRYDNRIAIISEELQSLQNQITRFKRERDTYKHMLEGAQKTLGDLKQAASRSGRESRTSSSSYDDLEEQRTKIATLEQQISCMEDELSEARLESSKLKTELVSERSAWEVKLSEMRSRVNELEEDRLLSGRTKIAAVKTRMELPWQKEREDQQRILQETSTLARDLRQTLFEVERERDKERLEAKRKQEQLKKAAEEEQEENRRKLNELQCDLLELRDAHAKLRTTNEKLRREKERNEKDREELRAAVNKSKRSEQDDEKRISVLLEQVDVLLKAVPEFHSGVYTPTPPRRTKTKSRESSPGTDYSRETSRERSVGYENRATDMQTVIQRLKEATFEIRQNRMRRAPPVRRAASTEHDSTELSRGTRIKTRNGNLNRRSLSLEQTVGQMEDNIWKGDDDSLSSMQSLDASSDVDSRHYGMDSRLSGGSTQSEMIGGASEKKKKKGIMGKLKKLTKSRSIDDQHYQPHGGDSLASDEVRGSKKDLKERFTGMFKRSGSSSRSNSVERKPREEKQDSSSLQRPLTRNPSLASSAVSRPSPTPSSRSSSLQRDTSSKYK